MKKQQLGKSGEEIACSFLKKNGYRIIERNYRCRYGEIDIVARHKESLIFVEVRSKTGKSFGTPEESVTVLKRQKLVSTAYDYLNTHRDLPENWRVDMVAIEFDEGKNKPARINILKNIVD